MPTIDVNSEKQKSEFWTLYEPRLNGGSEDYSRYQASVWHFLDPDLSDPDFQETYQNVCDEMVTRYRKGESCPLSILQVD